MLKLRETRFLIVTLALVCVLFPGFSMAQDADELKMLASAAVQASDWATAVTLYSELTRAEPENPAVWYRLGLATTRKGGDGAAARVAFEKALELGFAPNVALFAVTKSFARDGNSDAALETLEKLVQQGPSRFSAAQLGSDEAFSSFLSNPRFQAVVANLTPCSSAEYRQFDFWLGNWNVVSPQGQALGTNKVTQSMDGCLLMESWESTVGGQKGMSINYHDRDKGGWSQIYRDNSGNITQWPELVGGLINGAMVLASDSDAQPRSRWTWSKESEGRVRQMAETITDGENWTTVWDSYYVPDNE